MSESIILNIKQNDHIPTVLSKVLNRLKEGQIVELSNRRIDEYKQATGQKLTAVIELIKSEMTSSGSTIYQYNQLELSSNGVENNEMDVEGSKGVRHPIPVLIVRLSINPINDIDQDDQWTHQVTVGLSQSSK